MRRIKLNVLFRDDQIFPRIQSQGDLREYPDPQLPRRLLSESKIAPASFVRYIFFLTQSMRQRARTEMALISFSTRFRILWQLFEAWNTQANGDARLNKG